MTVRIGADNLCHHSDCRAGIKVADTNERKLKPLNLRVTVLMALVPVFWDARITLLLVAFVIGVVGSHMPAQYRHKVLLFRKHVVPDQRRG